MTTKIPSRYKDIISKCVLIHSGPPAVYQLQPKKEEIENLTKMTVGEKNQNKINKTILLVGETGTGKSTLINTLVNYTMGVKWEDEVWFQVAEETEKKLQLQSRTTDVLVYEIFGFEDETLPYSLTIIDTPGYGDTKGVNQDNAISQRLLQLFQSDDGIYEVHAVGLVIKATENQLSDRLLYIFSSPMSLFGKDMEKNIIALITHSDGRVPDNTFNVLEAAKIKCAKNEKNEPVHFLFDNCQYEVRRDESQFGLENAWKISERGMRAVTAFLKKSKPRNMMKTAEVLNDRSKLTACIQNLKEKFNLTGLKQTEIKDVHNGKDEEHKTEDKPPPHEKISAEDHTMTTKIPSRYKDIISKCVLIHSGPPAVYQLQPKKEEIENLTKMTVGEKNQNKINKTILLVGETGTGKSTLINTLVNYTMGVKWEDEVWFQIVEETEKKLHLQSRTTDVLVYEIFGFEDETLPYSLTIIDTPGYGDTRGIKQDDIISQRLLQLFQSDDGIHEVHAVGLVIKATENRLTDRLLYIFSSLMSLFGKDMEKNIIALITHSDGRVPDNTFNVLEAAKIKCAKNEKNEPVHFLFDNCQYEVRRDESQFGLENAWKISERGMREVTAFLKKSKPRKTMKTTEVLNDRSKLTACIQNLKEKFNLTGPKQRDIETTEEVLKKHKEEMVKNEKFTVNVDEVFIDKQAIDGGTWGFGFYFQGAVCCQHCKENCHFPGCTKVFKPENCKVMKDGHCTVCTNKCSVSVHVKQKSIYVTNTRTVKKTIEDMKEKYEKNKSEYENKLSLLKNSQKEMDELKAETSQLLNESYKYVVSLEQIALRADSASTVVHLDFLIEKMKEKGDTEKVQKLEEMRSKVDEGTREAL